MDPWGLDHHDEAAQFEMTRMRTWKELMAKVRCCQEDLAKFLYPPLGNMLEHTEVLFGPNKTKNGLIDASEHYAYATTGGNPHLFPEEIAKER